MLGGTGQMNFLIHNVGSPDDFDSWNVDGWDSEALGPVFQRLSCWMGQGGPNPTAAAHFTQSETCSLRGHHREGNTPGHQLKPRGCSLKKILVHPPKKIPKNPKKIQKNQGFF